MAVDSYGIKNQPYYDESKPGNTAADLGALADYAAAVGNTKVGFHADRVALTGNDLWSHLVFVEKDTKTRWLYNGTGWVLLDQARTAFAPTLQHVTVGSGGSSNGYYRIANGQVSGKAAIVFGSSGSISGGNFGMTPPIAVNSSSYRNLGTFVLFDSSGLVFDTGALYYDGTNIQAVVNAGGKVDDDTPVVTASGDQMHLDFNYETSNAWS